MKKFLLLIQFFILSISFAGDYFESIRKQAYENIELLPYNPHGWYTHEKQIKTIFAQKEIKSVVEVGAWLGKWTIATAQLLPEEGHFFAVDHWLGSIEHHNTGSYESSLLPTLYQQYCSNIIHAGLTNKVTPIRMSSLEASSLFKEKRMNFDLIYLDAAHDYQSVLTDLEAWYPLISSYGILCGDDWNLGRNPNGAGAVENAVKTFAKKHSLTPRSQGEFWWFDKGEPIQMD